MGLSIKAKDDKPDKTMQEGEAKYYESNIPMFYDNTKLINNAGVASLLRAYRGWVYICANKNSVAFSSVPLKLFVTKENPKQKVWYNTKPITKEYRTYLEHTPSIVDLPCVKKAAEVLEVTDHPIMDLLRKVNFWMNKFELLEITNIDMELTGNSYWYVIKNGLGMPAEIWRLQPDRVSIVPSRETFIKGYIFTSMDGIDIPFLPEEIIHFKFPNPNNMWYGCSPLQAMSDAYNLGEMYNRYEESLMKNNAIPSLALVAPKETMVSEEEWKRTITRWNATYGGYANTGKTAWLDSGFDIKTLATTPKEMAHDKGRKWVMQAVCAAYGVPISKVTTEGVNRANAKEGNYQYMSDTIYPRCVRFQEKLNEKLIPMIDEENAMFFAFDNPVDEDQDFILSERESNLKVYVTTINEERKKLGLDDVEWGDKPLVPAGTAPLNMNPPQPGAPVPGQPGAPQPGAPKPNAEPKPKPDEKENQALLDEKKKPVKADNGKE
jgi:HK97 family phage portal protein